jgi:hypothetical protein
MTVDMSSVADDGTTDWTGHGKVFWTRGTESNELNPRLTTGTLRQPEVIKASQDKKDIVTWNRKISLSAPPAISNDGCGSWPRPTSILNSTFYSSETSSKGSKVFVGHSGLV